MIINKTQLGEDWPFTVEQVAVVKIQVGNSIDKLDAFAVVHDFKMSALSGILEQYPLTPLHQSGIWADDPETGAKKSITPLMEFLCQK